MQIKELRIKNVGMIADETIKFDQPLLCFYGEVRQGKSTILNAVRWLCGVPWPADIIRHGQTDAFVELVIDGGLIRREWYVGRDGKTKVREIRFIKDGRPVANPASEIKRLLNPFTTDQEYFRNMGELERKRFLAELFAVDTTDLDRKIFDVDNAASNLRSEIKGYGEIKLVPVEPIDVAPLKAEKNRLQTIASLKRVDIQEKINDVWEKNRKAQAEWNRQSAAIQDANRNIRNKAGELDKLHTKIEELKKTLDALAIEAAQLENWLEKNKETPVPPQPQNESICTLRADLDQLEDGVKTATEEIDRRLSEAAAVQVRVEQFEKDQKRLKEKEAKEEELRTKEATLKQLRAEKVNRLKDAGNATGIPGLVFLEGGDFTYEGVAAGMLSTSQAMKLSSELAGRYPEGLGVELLDRAESLGRSIFDYVELAKKGNKTVLAAIVGQRPAAAPPEVGVFVVKDGQIIKDEE